MPSNYLANFTLDIDLPVGIALDIDLPLDGARDWTVVVRNDGLDPITAATVSYSPLGTTFTEPETAAALLLAPGATTSIVGTSRPLKTLRLTLTTLDPGVVVHIEGGGR